MMYHPKRYLLNLNTGVLHDTYNEKSQCQLSEITNKKYYEYKFEAESDYSFEEYCDYCLKKDG